MLRWTHLIWVKVEKCILNNINSRLHNHLSLKLLIEKAILYYYAPYKEPFYYTRYDYTIEWLYKDQVMSK